MGQIVAKYPGVCSACGARFPAGTTIEWGGPRQSRHAVCPKGAGGHAAAAKLDKGPDTASKEAAPITLTYDRGRFRPEIDSDVGRAFRVGFGAHKGKVVTVVSQRRQWIPEDGLSFGLSDDQGWLLTLYCREATPEEAEKVKAEEASKQAERDAVNARKEAERKALESERDRVLALLAGLVCAGESWDRDSVVDKTVKPEVVGAWDSGFYNVSVQKVQCVDGSTGYIRFSNGHDDFRSDFHANRAIVEASWRALAERLPLTPAQAAEWLTKYSKCSGHEFYEFIASQGEAQTPCEDESPEDLF